ncbi:NAD(P)/FAD-dependent oxidoreductase [Marinitenerispora sediminis]|uniref:Amino acid dehydrogenase n=1 Tax=Marinitenerispora sediminis TaxID=1931232 RepID=A0A368T7N6_9ACTN|nr:FAD-dependent oxidoreductase [Marinitenerispora sediminis]RCV51201.1 amino acid dehydrogenase [Marinitenerispora sediminis]RCV56449.1 amino acid dehydrogenase [Marinitenerispora sediminis]RCV60158.1 amino acid dehydrogenase [Marinitenerispora sediminis]
MHTDTARPPRSAVVVGAGMAGLATAWFLREAGIDVTVVDRRHVAAGASWGNAGWLTPAFSVPLPEPGALRLGLRTLLSPAAPVYVPPRADLRLARFLAAFTRNCTTRRWRVALSAYTALNRQALAAYDTLAEGGVAEPTRPAEPCLAAFGTAAERRPLVEELAVVRAAGQEVGFELLTGDQAREHEPALSHRIGAAVAVHGQRYLDPGAYLDALARSVRDRGGTVLEGAAVTRVHATGSGVRVATAGSGDLSADVAVLAAGAWLGPLARPFGVRVPVQSGRGYSFSLPAEGMPARPTYFAARRVVCTPLGDRVRVAGMMEFTGPDRPGDRRRVRAIVDAARPLLRDVDWTRRADEWVGARPCTADGLPLVGPTASPRVYVCGGHGMWGIALGPLTGRLLAEAVATGRPAAELAALHPLR